MVGPRMLCPSSHASSYYFSSNFKDIHIESGDAEAHGLSVLLCTYKFVACTYMLCDVLHTLAKLQSSLQATVGRLKEL